jgi:hypothetical protein
MRLGLYTAGDEDMGASAVVLYSLFEEQIEMESLEAAGADGSGAQPDP